VQDAKHVLQQSRNAKWECIGDVFMYIVMVVNFALPIYPGKSLS